MRYLFIVLVCGLGLGAATANLQPNRLQQLAPVHHSPPFKSGIFKIVGGSDPSNPAYHGTATLWRLASGTWAVNYTIGSAGVSIHGTGRVVDSRLIVGWVHTDDKGIVVARGITVYEQTETGLKGVWHALPGQGQTERENLIWLADND